MMTMRVDVVVVDDAVLIAVYSLLSSDSGVACDCVVPTSIPSQTTIPDCCCCCCLYCCPHYHRRDVKKVDDDERGGSGLSLLHWQSLDTIVPASRVPFV